MCSHLTSQDQVDSPIQKALLWINEWTSSWTEWVTGLQSREKILTVRRRWQLDWFVRPLTIQNFLTSLCEHCDDGRGKGSLHNATTMDLKKIWTSSLSHIDCCRYLIHLYHLFVHYYSSPVMCECVIRNGKKWCLEANMLITKVSNHSAVSAEYWWNSCQSQGLCPSKNFEIQLVLWVFQTRPS